VGAAATSTNNEQWTEAARRSRASTARVYFTAKHAASGVANNRAHALQLEADIGEKGVEEADVDGSLADEDDDKGGEIGIDERAAAGRGGELRWRWRSSRRSGCHTHITHHTSHVTSHKSHVTHHTCRKCR
jgi:hypothetical protein